MTLPVVNNVLELVGGTPMVSVGGPTEQIWAKCEHLNPGGSVKDRIGVAMIEQAERAGVLAPGMTVVEPTSGNTGLALAIACTVKGYPLVLTMPESMSLERRALLEAYGATLVLTPAEQAMNGAVQRAQSLSQRADVFMPSQFSNRANPDTHYRTTAEEILADLGGQAPDVFVAGVGTGGTVSGVGKRLKEHSPDTCVVAVEPAASPVLSGGPPGPTKIQGIGAGFVPENFDRSVVDHVVTIEDPVAWDTKTELSRTHGLLVGISSGANVAAARRWAHEHHVQNSERNDLLIVTLLCDTGERYFSLRDHFEQDSSSKIPISPSKLS